MKTKYAAHLIMAVRYRDHPRETIPLYENVLLVYADTDDEAMRQACALGRAEAAETDESFRWNGHPARWEFVGVRKLITCQPHGLSDRIGHGAELTYSLMVVRSEADLKKLVAGDPVEITYHE